MNIVARHRAALLEQAAGAKLLGKALKKRAAYLRDVWKFVMLMPHMFRELHKQVVVIQHNLEGMARHLDATRGLAVDSHQRLKHHERGPLMQSARVLQARRDRAEAAAGKLKSGNPAEQAAARQALEADAVAGVVGEPDVVLDGGSGQDATGILTGPFGKGSRSAKE